MESVSADVPEASAALSAQPARCNNSIPPNPRSVKGIRPILPKYRVSGTGSYMQMLRDLERALTKGMKEEGGARIRACRCSCRLVICRVWCSVDPDEGIHWLISPLAPLADSKSVAQGFACIHWFISSLANARSETGNWHLYSGEGE